MPTALARSVPRWLRDAALDGAAWLLQRRRRTSPAFWDGAPVTFFIWNAHSMGGTVRTVLRQAEDLVRRGYPVTVVSVVKHPKQTGAFFAMDPRIEHEVLVDRPALAEGTDPVGRLLRWLDGRRSLVRLLSAGRADQGSLLLDLRLLRRLARARRGVVIGTRLGLNLALARFGHPAALRVAQEHLYLDIHPPKMREQIARTYTNLDVIACLTEQDAAAYRSLLADGQVRVEVIPNAIPDELPPPAPLERDRIVAVGRFTRMKGFDLLVDAFAQVAEEHPSWDLRIIGKGPDRKALKRHVKKLGLADRIALPGPSKEVQRELSDASIFVLSSRFEPFGIVLLEAMASGLSIVSYACPMGPPELIVDGESGLLAPPGDVEGLAAALRKVMEGEQLRRSLAAGARERVVSYTATRVGDRWLDVFREAARYRGGDGRVRAQLGSSTRQHAGMSAGGRSST